MKHGVKKKALNMTRGRRDLMLRNLATSLVQHEKIQTTEAKAKVLQPLMEKLVIKAKNENKVAAIREVNRYITSELSAKKMIDEVAKRYQDRQSGFTRITKMGFRSGDAAPMVQIELT